MDEDDEEHGAHQEDRLDEIQGKTNGNGSV